MRAMKIEALRATNAYLSCESNMIAQRCGEMVDLEATLRRRNRQLGMERLKLMQFECKVHQALRPEQREAMDSGVGQEVFPDPQLFERAIVQRQKLSILMMELLAIPTGECINEMPDSSCPDIIGAATGPVNLVCQFPQSSTPGAESSGSALPYPIESPAPWSMDNVPLSNPETELFANVSTSASAGPMRFSC